MHANAVETGIRQREGDRAVFVADHRDVRPGDPERESPLDQQQIGRVVGLQVVGLDVGPTAQSIEGEVHPFSLGAPSLDTD